MCVTLLLIRSRYLVGLWREDNYYHIFWTAKFSRTDAFTLSGFKLRWMKGTARDVEFPIIMTGLMHSQRRRNDSRSSVLWTRALEHWDAHQTCSLHALTKRLKSLLVWCVMIGRASTGSMDLITAVSCDQTSPVLWFCRSCPGLQRFHSYKICIQADVYIYWINKAIKSLSCKCGQSQHELRIQPH